MVIEYLTEVDKGRSARRVLEGNLIGLSGSEVAISLRQNLYFIAKVHFLASDLTEYQNGQCKFSCLNMWRSRIKLDITRLIASARCS